MDQNPLCKKYFRGNLNATDFELFYHWTDSFCSEPAIPKRRPNRQPWHANSGSGIILADRDSSSHRLCRNHVRWFIL